MLIHSGIGELLLLVCKYRKFYRWNETELTMQSNYFHSLPIIKLTSRSTFVVFVLYIERSTNIVLSYLIISTFIFYYDGYVNFEYGQIMPWMTRFIFKVIFHIYIDKPSKTFHVKMIQI